MNNENTGRFLSKLRKDKILTQSELASLCNVSYQAVSQWETGKTLPDIDSLKKLSEIYDISINEILEGKKKSPDEEEINISDKLVFEIKSKLKTNLTVSIVILVVSFILFVAGLYGREIQLMILPSFIIALYNVIYLFLNKDSIGSGDKYMKTNNILLICSSIFFVIAIIIFVIGIINGGLTVFGFLQPFVYFALILNFRYASKL